MKLTLSVIKVDIGSIGGHIQPSRQLLEYAGIMEMMAELEERFTLRV